MKFVKKTDYAYDLRLFREPEDRFWYAVLGLLLLASCAKDKAPDPVMPAAPAVVALPRPASTPKACSTTRPTAAFW